MNAVRALLVDDEPLALRRLAVSLKAFEEIEVVDSTTSARKAVEMIEELRPDVVFLDIAMPGLSGFDVADSMPPDLNPAIVFVTAYDRHAVRAFGVDAADYLMKPVAPDRLRAAIDRARAWLRGRAGDDGPAEDEAPPDRLSPQDSLWVHRHQALARIRVEDVLWIEAEGDYVRLHAAGETGLLRMTLSGLHARLDPAEFVRVHRSAVCRIAAITGMRRKPTGALVVSLANGDDAPVGRSYSGGLRALLKRIDDAANLPA